MSTSAIEAGRATVRVGLDSSRISKESAAVLAQLRGLAANIRSIGAPLAAVGGTITASIGGALASLAWPVKLAADIEMTSAAFTTMLKSGEKANALLGDLRKFAASTPFEFPEIADAAKKLLAFGSSASSVEGELRTIGDIASGVGVPIGDLAEIYGKARVNGRLFAEDVNQLTGRGIPVIQQFAKQFGVADTEVRKLVEQGKIGFPQLQQALISMTTGAGDFAGGMERASKTTIGRWSSLKDAIAEAVLPIGEALIPKLQEFLTFATATAGKVQMWITANAQLIPTIVTVAAKVGAAGIAIGGLGASLIATSSAIDAGRVVINGFGRVLGGVGKVIGFITGQQATSAAANATAAKSHDVLAAASTRSATGLTAMTTASKSSTTSTAAVGVAAAESAIAVGAYAAALDVATPSLIAYGRAAAAANANPLEGIGSIGVGKRKGKRGPGKGKSAAKGKGQSPDSGDPPVVSDPIGNGVGAAAGATAAVAETGIIAGAWALVSGAVIKAGAAIGGVLASIASAPGLLAIAVGGAVLYIANRAGLVTKAWGYVSKIFTNVYDTAKQTFGGIVNAIKGGNFALAGKIAFTAFKLAVTAAIDETLQVITNFPRIALTSIYKFGVALVKTIVDLVGKIPQLIKAAISGGQSIGQILYEAFTNKFGETQSTLGKQRAALKEELDQLTKEAAQLGQAKQDKQAKQQPKPDAQGQEKPSQPGATTALPTNAKAEAETEKERVTAGQERIKQLRAEILEMDRGAAAAELFQLAQEGVGDAELREVAQLQRLRLARQQTADKLQEEAEARKKLVDDARSLTEAMKTPGETARAEIDKIKQMQSQGLIDQKTAGRAIGQVLTKDMPNYGGGEKSWQDLQTEAQVELLKRQRQMRANMMAAQNSTNISAQRAPVQTETEDRKESLQLQRDQLLALKDIAKNRPQPVKIM